MTLDNRGILTPCPSCGATNRMPYDALGRTIRCSRCHTTLSAPAAALEVPDEASFRGALASATPVVVDFWAPWCGPCRMMAPELEKLAAQRAGQLLIVKVNTDALPGLASAFQIRSIPTLAVFREGREVTRVSGVRPAADVDALVFGASAAGPRG